MVRVADARSRSIGTLSSRRIAARGKPSLIKSALCATPETLSATSPEKPGSVRAVSENGSNSARLRTGAPRRQSPARPAISSIIYRAAGRKAAFAAESCSTRSSSAGYTGSFSHLERLLAKWRRARGAKVVTLPTAPEPTTAPTPTIAMVPRAVDPATGWSISPIVAASLCIKPRGLLTPGQAAKVDALKSASPDFTAMRQLAMRFRGILRSKDIQKFDVWLNDAQQSGIYAMQRFARTIRRDVDAVRNALRGLE